LHSYDTHIKIKHKFMRDYVKNRIIDLQFVFTNNKLVDIFTKPIEEDKLLHIKNPIMRIYMTA